jgi:hypothetical protein
LLVNTNSAEVALDSSASTSAILLETSADKLDAIDASAEVLLDSSVDTLVVNDVSAEVLVDSSVDTLVVNDVSAEVLVDSSVDTLVVNDESPEILDDSSEVNSFPNSFKAAVTLLVEGPKVVLPENSMFVAVIPDGLVITGLVKNKSDCKSKTILVFVAIKKIIFYTLNVLSHHKIQLKFYVLMIHTNSDLNNLK